MDNSTGLLLEPCGLRAVAMFNDRFTLLNYSGAPAGEKVVLDESGISWDSDDKVFVNSPAFESGEPAHNPAVAYLHHQQPHIVAPGEGLSNEHFRVWMHAEAFPVFNKRYANVRGAGDENGGEHPTLREGAVLVFEVDAHYPVMQFGGAK